MTDDEKIVELFFRRSECALQELDRKYGKLFRNLSYKIVGRTEDAAECVKES